MRKKFFSIFALTLIILALSVIGASAYYSEQTEITEITRYHENSAYGTFGETDEFHGIKYVGGEHLDRYGDELYSKKSTYKGITGREVWKENVFYLQMDPEFASPEDCAFAVIIDYWDYAGTGYFHLEYSPQEEGVESKRISILKEGFIETGKTEDGLWHRLVVYISDAKFTQSLPNNCDLRIYSGAFNTFAHVEVVNLSRYGADTMDDYGITNDSKAGTLQSAGIYEWDGKQESLFKQFTREEAAVQIIKTLAPEEVDKKEKSSFKDVSEEKQMYVAAAQKLGIVFPKTPTELGVSEIVTQEEMIKMFIALVGGDKSRTDIYQYGKELGLVLPDSMIFQMKKPANHDNFVSLAMAVFVTPLNGQKAKLYQMIDDGILDMATLWQDAYIRSLLKKEPIKMAPNKVIDPETGRTWYYLTIFGTQAIKAYMAQPAFDYKTNSKFYFRDEHNGVWEYNIGTEYLTFIDDGYTPYNYMYVTTQTNHLLYLNKKKQIIKMDCETHEKTVAVEIPEWQKGNISLIHTTLDGRYISLEWDDSRLSAIDKNLKGIPVCDLETGEWDLRYDHKFSTPMTRPDHIMVNPVDPNYVMFIHDTDAAGYERIWLLDRETGEKWNCVEQKRQFVEGYGYPGKSYYGISGFETYGHESWCDDGYNIFVASTARSVTNNLRHVMYQDTNGVRSCGFVICGMDNKNRKFVPFDDATCHPGISHDYEGFDTNRWIVSDTSYSVDTTTKLWLLDAYSGKNYYLGRTPQTGLDPGHTHPNFSWNNQYIFFGLYTPDLKTPCLGWMDVSDITTNPLQGGHYEVSENCEIFTYEDTDNYIIKREDKDGTYFEVPMENFMYVDIDTEVTYEEAEDVEIFVTFKDDNINPVKITYYVWRTINGVNYCFEMTENIPREGTGKWVTKSVKIDGMSTDNMGILGSDFKLSGVGSGANIRSVSVKVRR